MSFDDPFGKRDGSEIIERAYFKSLTRPCRKATCAAAKGFTNGRVLFTHASNQFRLSASNVTRQRRLGKADAL
jgi:hypothetical protein